MRRPWILVLAAACAAAPAQIVSGPGICFAFNDNTASPIASLPLVGGGELLVGFVAPSSATIERIDVYAGFIVIAPMTLQVFPFNGVSLGPQIASVVFNQQGAGWIPFTLAPPVSMTGGSTYVLRFTIASGSVPIDGDANQPVPLTYAFACGPNPPVMFPPCSSYPTLGTHGTRLRFRALACGPTPLASATFVGTGCGASPAPTLGAIGPPVLGLPFWFQVASPFGGGAIHVFWALGPATAGFDPGWGGGCQTYLDLISVQTLLAAGFEPLVTFFWSGLISSGSVNIPNDPALAGLVVTTQALISNVSGVPTPVGAVHLTNAMELSLGY